NEPPTLTLTDTSKYGTSVNQERLDSNVPRVLRHGDVLTFGVFQSKFRVEYEALVACSSCVDNEGKASLAQDVQQLGGRLVSSWSEDCTHLVMPAVKVTIKTICALLCCRPIVRPHYFSEFRKALLEKKAPPKAEDFCPDIDEPTLDREVVDLGVRLQRRSIFQGKTFVFLSAKQLKRLSSAVTFGRGQAQLLEEGSLPTALLESPQTCVVDAETGSSQVLQSASAVMWNDSVARILQRKGLRMIAESEIGLAAIYVTTDLYCNPSAQMYQVCEKPRISRATLSQSVSVDETTLPAASQNITAYAANTELSSGISRMDTSGPTSVGETPEKEQRRTGVLSKRPTETDTACKSLATETSSSASAARAKSLQSTNEKDALPSRARGDGQPTSRPPLSNGAKTRSPEKQANSLTNYFQPISRKRTREGSDLVGDSEAKLPRKGDEQEDEMESGSGRSVPQHRGPSRRAGAPPDPESPISAPTVRSESKSLELVQDQDHSSGSSNRRPTEGKRKEMVKGNPPGDDESEMDMEDLESIMSLPMEESDKQGEACKKRRTDHPAKFKQEEASFVADVKPALKGENEEGLPRNVLIIQFRSLVVDKPPRPRLDPQNPQKISGKNFKKFQKVPVPGSSGLPRIIGGSELVAHNRGKNSELEEWLREAAEEESRNEREETLGDDLFRCLLGPVAHCSESAKSNSSSSRDSLVDHLVPYNHKPTVQ
ncbi:nibrin-like, partial [Scleropages formosus]